MQVDFVDLQVYNKPIRAADFISAGTRPSTPARAWGSLLFYRISNISKIRHRSNNTFFNLDLFWMFDGLLIALAAYHFYPITQNLCFFITFVKKILPVGFRTLS